MTSDLMSILGELIQIAQKNEDGYRAAAERVQDSVLKQALQKRAEYCHNAVTDLQGKVKQIVHARGKVGSLVGGMPCDQASINEMLIGKENLTIIEEWDTSEYTHKVALC
jgi:uncharacterized protein (TIGR02284 family)